MANGRGADALLYRKRMEDVTHKLEATNTQLQELRVAYQQTKEQLAQRDNDVRRGYGAMLQSCFDAPLTTYPNYHSQCMLHCPDWQ